MSEKNPRNLVVRRNPPSLEVKPMKKKAYQDATSNMRAAFYDRTKKQKKPSQQAKEDPENVRKLCDNVKRHQKPMTTGS
jgi:hypothetical protein